PRDGAVIERLKVDADDSRPGRRLADQRDVLDRHYDRVALVEHGAAGVDHRHVGAVQLECRGDLVAPDRVSRDVVRPVASGPHDEPRYRPERVPQLAGSVLALRAPDHKPVPGELCAHGRDPPEAEVANLALVAVLAEERQVLAEELLSDAIEMV